ncbi:MAG: GNAT family N-acetyltransferase [Cyclobacteriaceae bacterium]|nr:GNAT family N-acetyltransferase [Cyclobacteriaceae bacterium]
MTTLNTGYYQDFEEFEKCFELQKEVFQLSDKDTLPPIFLNLLSRNNPRTGFAIGAFLKESNDLVGYFLNIAGVDNKTIYGMSLGVKPSFREKNLGLNLFLYLKKEALQYDVKKWYGIFEVLEGNLGNLYFNKLGMKGIKYEKEPYIIFNDKFPVDKVLIEWDLELSVINDYIDKKLMKIQFRELVKEYPILDNTNYNNEDKVLIQIPCNLLGLKQSNINEAIKWRISTRNLFDEFINRKKFIITKFYSNENESNKNFYLLEKQKNKKQNFISK